VNSSSLSTPGWQNMLSLLLVEYQDAGSVFSIRYSPVKSRTMKVFSAHVMDTPAYGDPNFYRYYGGSVGLLSWRRGEWEEEIMLDVAAPRSLSEAFVMGLFRPATTLPIPLKGI
jgi:hypothetical protein